MTWDSMSERGKDYWIRRVVILGKPMPSDHPMLVPDGVRRYTTDANAALEVVEAMRKRRIFAKVEWIGGSVEVQLWDRGRPNAERVGYAKRESFPLAVCEAAHSAIGGE